MVSTAEIKAMSDDEDRMQIADVPDVFTGKLTKEEIRTDQMGRQCLYLSIDIGGRTFTEKMTPMHLAELTKAMARLNIQDTQGLVGKAVEWKVTTFRIGHPRHFPSRFV